MKSPLAPNNTVKRGLLLVVLTLSVAALLLFPAPTFAQEKGDFFIQLSQGYYVDKVIPGKTTTFYLDVRNTTGKAISNIKFSADLPEGWTAEFNPASIDSLADGALQTVSASVRPDPSTGKGNYRIVFIADAGAVRRITTAFVNVDSSNPIWLYVGISIAAVVVAGLIFIFLRIGRN